MRLFSIPIQIQWEEKTFGGVLTIKQFVYLIATITLSVSAFFLLRFVGLPLLVCIIIAVPMLVFGLTLAFIKIQDISLDKFLLHLVRYKKRTRIFVLRGDD